MTRPKAHAEEATGTLAERMADTGWLHVIGAALGGGFVGAAALKLLDIMYQEFQRGGAERQTATKFVDEHLDPLLKSADELSGKLRSLSESNFLELYDVNHSRLSANHQFASLLFLFGRFWAQIEIIHQQGMTVAMGKDRRGAHLQKFFDCLESRRVRIVDRILQRAVGEVFIKDGKTVNFVDFVGAFDSEGDTQQWMMPLASFLSRMRHTTERQKLLQYGAVVHALIDTLDPSHLVTRERPSWPNKLTRRSWQDLNYRVFGRYLDFVENKGKYLGPPKRAAHRRKGKAAGKPLEPAVGSGTSVGLPLARRPSKGRWWSI
jgi:hypothetical protein